ncbi:MAG: hypothetical protein AAF602_01670 [Myxococcota bacterium]
MTPPLLLRRSLRGGVPTLLGMALLLALGCRPGGPGGPADPGGDGPVEDCGDADQDGLTDCEEDLLGTHPNKADTDGDGFLDGEEEENWDRGGPFHLRFNPLVADMPRLNLRQVGVPDIQLHVTTVDGVEDSYGMSQAQGSEAETFASRGGSEVDFVEEQHTAGFNAEVGISTSGPAATIGGAYEYNTTDSTTSTTWWDEQQRLLNRQESASYLDAVKSRMVTEDGGSITVQMELYNDGDVSYTLENFDLAASIEDPLDPNRRIPIGTLQHDGPIRETPPPQGAFLEPQASAKTRLNLQLETSPSVIRRVLEASNRLVLEPNNIALTGERPDVDLQLAAQDIRSRTAEVILDYGDLEGAQRYRVAIDNRDNTELSLTELFEHRLNLAVAFGVVDLGRGTANEGIVAIGEVANDPSGKEYWTVAFSRAVGSSQTNEAQLYHPLTRGLGPDDLVLQTGDVLHLVFIRDSDQDGLSDRRELLEGTDADVPDTDGDHLDDAVEVFGWETNLVGAPCDQGSPLAKVTSNPLVKDSDGDGEEDAAEKAACTNPMGDLAVDAVVSELVVNRGDTVTLTAYAENFLVEEEVEYAWTQVVGGTLASGGRQIAYTAPNEVTTAFFEVMVTDAAQLGATAFDVVRVVVVEDKDRAVFVDPWLGSPSATGRFEDPVSTFGAALLRISQPGTGIYAVRGFYDEPQTLRLPARTHVYGGYAESWERQAGSRSDITVRSPVGLTAEAGSEVYLNRVGIFVDASATPNVDGLGIDIEDVATVQLEDVYVWGPSVDVDGSGVHGPTSTGMRVRGAQYVEVLDSTIRPGDGGSARQPGQAAGGLVGADGSDASDLTAGAGGTSLHHGLDGAAGAAGVETGVCEDGALGGIAFNNFVDLGLGGVPGDCVMIGLEPTFVSYAGDGQPPTIPGADGAAGEAAIVPTGFTDGAFAPALGAVGSQGNGGGGGGGGGSAAKRNAWEPGGAGGGGGQGGQGGFGGTAGHSGGGAFGVVLVSVPNALFHQSLLQGDDPGRGAPGGLGGVGGAGGAGGAGSLTGLFRGGDGGAGATGGHGGQGGAGAGGPTAAIVLLEGSVADVDDSTIRTLPAGRAGNAAGNHGWNYGVFLDASSSQVTTSGVVWELAVGAGHPDEFADGQTNR